jgi:hypothetical protein
VPVNPQAVVDRLAPDRADPVRHAPVLRHQTVTAVVDGDAPGLTDLVGAVRPLAASVAVRRTTLNDVFLQLTAAGAPEPAGAGPAATTGASR